MFGFWFLVAFYGLIGGSVWNLGLKKLGRHVVESFGRAASLFFGFIHSHKYTPDVIWLI